MLKKLLFFTGILCFLWGIASAQIALEIQVSSSSDDAEELSASEQNSSLNAGDLDLASSDLKLVDDASWNGTGQTVGIRFTNLDIPRGARILNAHIEFAIDDDNSDATTVEFRVQDNVNAPTFVNTPYNISSRSTFADSVVWNIPAWETTEIGQTRSTPEVTLLVQQLVNRSDWTAGNAIAFIVTGSGEREVTTFDANASLAPKLVVSYILEGRASIPVSSSTDDAEELSASEQNSSLNAGDLDLASSDLELVDDASWNGTGQAVGIRFANVSIPKGATIQHAYIEFAQDANNSEATELFFNSEAADNATTYQNTPFNISGREYNWQDSIAWLDVPAFDSVGSLVQTPDLSAAVQAVVDREGWLPNNAMAFMVTGTGEREVTTFDANASLAPRLVVEYQYDRVIYVPELVAEIPDQDLVAGWDIEVDFSQYFVDRDSELSYIAVITGTTGLPAGLALNGSVLSGIHATLDTFDITVTASSNGESISDEFRIVYGVSTGDFTLAIFHNNDGESDMLPDSITVYGQATTGGSVGQFKATLDRLRAQAASRGYESIMLSSGDNFLAGLEYNASQANGVYYDAMALNAINYDAICLGNHDFDFGTQVLADLINAFTTNPAPYLSANLSFENVPELHALVNTGRISSSTVVTKGSEQIGVIGLTTPLLPIISSPGNTTVSESIVDSLQAQVNELSASGINKIILISHLQNYQEDLALAARVSGVDIIIAGGGDELLTNDPNLGAPYNTPVTDVYPVVATDLDGNNVYIVTTPGNYRFLGNLLVDFDASGVVTKVYPSDPVLVFGETDQALVDSIETPIAEYIGDLSTHIIAVVEDTLDYRREYLRGEETNGGNLFADAILWQAQRNAASFGASVPQVALQNSGGLRIESLIMPGDFTEDLTYEIAAFTNIVSVVEDITPEKFLELIAHGVASAPTLDGRFPQISGFEVVYYQGEPEGSAGVQSITLNDGTVIVENGEVVAGAPSITMATIDFTANGGDGYPFAPYTYTTLGSTYQQAFRNFLVSAEGLNGIVPAAQYPYGVEASRIVSTVYENPALSSVLLSEDFNDCPSLPAGWLAYSVSSNHNWSCTDYGASGETGDFGLEMNGYGADAPSEDWLITPEMTLGNAEYFLSFNSMVRYGGPALEILYSNDYSGAGDPNAATWTNIAAAEAAVDVNTSSNDYVNSGDISLAGITGNIYVAFKYTSTGTGGGTGARYRIDDVEVSTGVLLYENFNAICANSTYAPEGWTVAELGTPGLVGCSSTGYENNADDYSFRCNGYGTGAGEVWAITPLLALGATDYVLTFASRVQYGGPMPTVVYSTDYSGVGDPNNATWTDIPEASSAITGTFGLSPEIDLSFLGEDAYIAFKYISEGSSGGQSRIFYLDEVRIAEPAEILEGGEVSIAQIQGTTEESPLVNSIVTTTGIVTAYFNGVEPYEGAGYDGNITGFYMQDYGDNNDSTSDGIYVYTHEAVKIGDSIVVTGLVTEYYGLTEINEVESLEIISSDHIVPEAVQVTLPLASAEDFERYEGMLVEFTNELTVTENRNIENYGELRLSANGMLYQPTQIVDPNDADSTGITANGNSNVEAVNDHLELVNASNFLLDDARTSSYPSPIPYLDEQGTVVAGSKVNNVKGIMTYGYSFYRLYPTVKPEFTYFEREELPSVGDATLKVAAFNVLNYFNGDGQGGGFPTSRGAKTFAEFEKQSEKIVAALIEIDADVVGLMEIENDEDNGYSAVKDLVDAINTKLGSEIYDFISTGIIESDEAEADEIKVAMIYKPATVDLDGDYAILTNAFDPAFNDDYNRPALAQTFAEKASGEKLTVVVNHLKSKGSDCDDLGDANDNDGQGNCNVTRTRAAGTLASWLESDPTGSGAEDYLIIGDLNAYAQEDPIDTLRARGYVNLLDNEVYSYVYDGQFGTLDYGIANANLADKITEARIWHINSVEPDMLSYYGVDSMYEANAYRSSDHDPVIIGIKYEAGLRVSGFTLVDSRKRKDIMEINNNDTIDIAEIGNIKVDIRTNIEGGDPRFVFMYLDGNYGWANLDFRPPYSLFSKWWSWRPYNGKRLRNGSYTIYGLPYENWFTPVKYDSASFVVVNSPYRKYRRFKDATVEEETFAAEVIQSEDENVAVYPMPFVNELNISLTDITAEEATIKLYNNMGALVFAKTISLDNGTYTFTEDFLWLSPGLYFIVIDEADFSKTVIKK